MWLLPLEVLPGSLLPGSLIANDVVPAVVLLSAVLLWPDRSTIRAKAAGAALARPQPTSTLQRWLGAMPWPRHTAKHPDLLPLLDGLAASLSAGLTPEEALRMASRGSTQEGLEGLLHPVLTAARQGEPLGGPWQRLARDHDNPDLASLARAWMISERLGCPLAEAVSSTASTSRARTMLEQRLDSATAGARATCALLTVLPLGGVGIALLLGIDPISLYGTPISVASALGGISLLMAGRWIVNRMIAGVHQAVR